MDTKQILFEHEKIHSSFLKNSSFDIFIKHLEIVKQLQKNKIKHLSKDNNELDVYTEKSMGLVSALKEAWNPDVLSKEIKSFFNVSNVSSVNVLSSGISRLKSGLFLNSLNKEEKKWKVLAIKNFSYDGNSELSPSYSDFEIGRDKTANFLIDGYKFLKKDDDIIMVHVSPAPFGTLIFGVYALKEEVANKFSNNIEKDMNENNFLKGEKISLSGKFLTRFDKGWDDVILSIDIVHSLQQLEKFFDCIKTDDFSQRGFIFSGPPGTGKTLSANILAEKIKGTFIWISEKEFIDEGYPRYTINQAFQLAKELSPSVLFFEDIDNILLSNVDIFKTQLDGLEKHNGLMVILSTNHPQNIPDELLNRPGRFDEIVSFDLPDLELRKSLIKMYLKESIADEDIGEVAEKIKGFSGAHVKELARQVYIISKLNNRETTKEDILEAMGKIIKQNAFIESIRSGK